MSKVRWGVLSTAKIGTKKVIPAMQQGQFCQVTAIASRDAQRAKKAAAELGIPKSFGSYEEILADPDVDAIYNPLPNHLHVPWSIKALEAGKHVLCEKPIGLSSAEAQQLVDAAKQFPDLKLMEAFMYRHNLQWQRAKEIVRSGGIGELRTIQSFFSYFNDNEKDIRNQADIGGGGLMDIGCYNISLSRFLVDGEPNRVVATVEYDPNFHVDRLATVIMEFDRGVTSTFTCSTQLTPFQRVGIFGTTGRVEIEIPFNAPNDRPCQLRHETDAGIEEVALEVCDQYTIQGDLFSQAILNGTEVPTPISDAIKNMRVIESTWESGKKRTWIDLERE